MLSISKNLEEYQKYYIVSRTHLDDIRNLMKRLELYSANVSEDDILNFMEQLAIRLNKIQLGDDVIELTEELVQKFRDHRDKVQSIK